jgi:catechol 2,3-dioxygenase-like lactoylglutathione lyase family enzyme
MLDHVTIGVSDIEQSKKFYDRALRPLGITRLYAEGERFAGYGIPPKAFFWIGHRAAPQTGAHICGRRSRNRGAISSGSRRGRRHG